MKATFPCDICGDTFPTDQKTAFDGQELCPGCLEAHTTTCSECGERIWRDDNAGSRDHPLCRDCYDDDYTTCCRCGALLRCSSAYYEAGDEDEDHPYCDTCFYALPRDSIQDYCYKPEPIFYGEGTRYFGVELELDGAGESTSNASAVLELANRTSPLAYCKHDGSLDDGFEIVTHPMTLEYHETQMPWRAVLEKAAGLGYQSHRAKTCGLHVHVNRDTFGGGQAAQDACIARVLYFFEKHWEELLKFSRRTQLQLRRWATRYGYQERPMDILDHAKKGYGGGRYSSVNLQNGDTVEFRMFRGTLKLNTLIATLQLVNRVCDAAVCLSDEELKGLSWTTFVSRVTEPELIQYLKERRLYVNEPVETGVEL